MKRLDVSRDILVNQARLGQENVRAAIHEAVNMERELITWAIAAAQRTLEASKALADGGIAVVRASIERFNARLEAYRAKAYIYETVIKKAQLQADVYKTQIDAAAVTSEQNQRLNDLYKSQLGAVELLFGLYKTDMEASRLSLEVERTKVDNYDAGVRAYAASINAKTAEFNLYNSSVEAEKNKAQVYAIQTESWAKRVDAIRSQAELAIKEAEARIAANGDKTKIYQADIEAFRVKTQAAVERLGAVATAFGIEMQGFDATAKAYTAISGVEIKDFEARIQQSVNEANLALREAEVSLSNYEKVNALRIQALQGGAQVSAQLAAGALAGVSAAAHVQGTDTYNRTDSNQLSIHHSSSRSVSATFAERTDSTGG